MPAKGCRGGRPEPRLVSARGHAGGVEGYQGAKDAPNAKGYQGAKDARALETATPSARRGRIEAALIAAAATAPATHDSAIHGMAGHALSFLAVARPQSP